MQKTTRTTFTLLLLTLSLQGTFSKVYSQSPDRESLINRIEFYLENSNQFNESAKIRHIQGFLNQRFDEVLTLAKKELLREVRSQQPDLLVIYGWLEVIQSIGSSNDAALIRTLQSEIEKGSTSIELSNDGLELHNQFEKVGKFLKEKDPTPLPSLKATSEIVHTPRNTQYEVIKRLVSKLKENQEYAGMNNAIEVVLSNEVLTEHQQNRWSPALNRSAEVIEISNILVRMNSRVPLVIGDSGVGKSSVVRGLVENIIEGKLPAGIHTNELAGSFVIQTSASKLQSLSDAPIPKYEMAVVRNFFNSVKKFETEQKAKVIVVIEGANRLSEAQIDAMEPFLARTIDPFNVILVSNSQGSSKLIGNSELANKVEIVSVSEFDEKATFELIKQSHLSQIEGRYNVRISDDVLNAAIEVAAELRPDLKRPIGPIKLLQDLAIVVSRESKGETVEITKQNLFSFAAKRMKMSVVPQDREAFLSYLQKIKTDIKAEVKGQDAAVDRLTDLLGEAMTSKGKKSRAAVVVGTTGTGKTMIAKTLAKKVLNSDDRMLEIDMNQLKADDGGNSLFGPKPGYVGSDKNRGLLTEFVDKNGSGTIMIVVNELEKAHPSQIERLMEVLDTNGFTPSDGRHRQMPRVLWIFTSNQGATNFFPSDFLKTATADQIASIMAKTTSDDVKNAFLQPTSLAGQAQTVKPEVLARFDTFILQAPILKGTAIDIAQLKTQSHIQTYKAQDLGDISVDAEFSKVFAEEVYDPASGVRELERRVRSEVDKLYNEHLKKFGTSKSLKVVTNPPAPGTENITFTVTNERNQSLVIEGPKFAFQNPLYNPVLKARLKSLESDLNQEVFGQETYAQKLAASIRDNVVDQGSRKPVSVYVTGGTGMGKTEMVRVTARKLYGSEEFLLKLEMGMVNNIKDLSNIFQSAQGYVGSDQPGSFERFLQSHKEGVIVFDEMGNAGGNDKNAKEEIGKYLYSILDDGTWTSPVTKRTYSLKNYIFVFTGNEAEVIFKGNTQDDMLRAIWKKNSSEDKARELLRNSGLSPAFIGRIGSVIITEPPTTETKMKITGKLIHEWKTRMEAQQPIKIMFDDQFIQQVSKLVYSPNEGGRSVINFVKTTLSAATSSGIFEIDFMRASPENRAEVRLSLETQTPARPFYEVKPDTTLAKLHLEIVQEGKTIYEGNADFTSSAKFMKQIKKTDAIKTAFHEAGHAITNDPRISGRRLDHLTIIPADGFLGYARYEDIPGFTTNYNRSTLLDRLTTLVAGSEAELLVGGEVNSGQSSDLSEERKLLNKAAVSWGLVPELQGVELDEQGLARFNSRQQAIFIKFANEMLTEARKRASQILEDQWYLVALVSRELIQHGEISGASYEQLVQKANSMDADFIARFKLKSSPAKVTASLKKYEAKICNMILGR